MSDYWSGSVRFQTIDSRCLSIDEVGTRGETISDDHQQSGNVPSRRKGSDSSTVSRGSFDVKGGMPYNLDLTYIEKFDGDFRIDVETRRKTGSELEQIKQRALAILPTSKWPVSLHPWCRLIRKIINSDSRTMRPGFVSDRMSQSIFPSKPTTSGPSEPTAVKC